METKTELTLHTSEYSETWEVFVGSETYELNEKQIAFLQEATFAGNRGMVWFDGFSISIPHIHSSRRTKRVKKIPNQNPQPKGYTYEAIKDQNGKITSYQEIPIQ